MRRKQTTKVRFHNTPLHKRKEPHALHFLVQRSSFWIATFSLFAFVIGNMVGQHGWYVFWKSVMGKEEYIAYTGTVAPIEHVPDYKRWAEYGGDPHEHTFRQVPQATLTELPAYNPLTQRRHREDSAIGQVYSVGYMGSYATGGERDGSHPGVDIRVPVGTPVRSIANGVVTEVKDGGGFGKVIVVKHPNVPDPARPRETTTLYSVYAHLSAMYVEEDMIVQKGERIALSGESGLASGPHLHFQIDREEAPWHPYWPFTSAELRQANLDFFAGVNAGFHKERVQEFTVHPMLYVQSNYPPLTLIASADETATAETYAAPRGKRVGVHTVRRAPVSRSARLSRIQAQRAERIKARLARRGLQRVAPKPPVVEVAIPEPVSEPVSTVEAPPAPVPEPVVVSRETVVSVAPSDTTAPPPARDVHQVLIEHDGSFAGRGWENVTVTLLDENGDVVRNPTLQKKLYLRTAFGEAEFRPAILTVREFRDGSATVHMLPRGRRTVVVEIQPFGTISRPMQYRK